MYVGRIKLLDKLKCPPEGAIGVCAVRDNGVAEGE
jgi:hypothetical protein